MVAGKKKKKSIHSLLGLDGVHRSDVIAGNVSSSTCSKGTSLPPVSLAENKVVVGGRKMQVAVDTEIDEQVNVCIIQEQIKVQGLVDFKHFKNAFYLKERKNNN